MGMGMGMVPGAGTQLPRRFHFTKLTQMVWAYSQRTQEITVDSGKVCMPRSPRRSRWGGDGGYAGQGGAAGAGGAEGGGWEESPALPDCPPLRGCHKCEP